MDNLSQISVNKSLKDFIKAIMDHPNGNLDGLLQIARKHDPTWGEEDVVYVYWRLEELNS
jgi:hypothetical protein